MRTENIRWIGRTARKVLISKPYLKSRAGPAIHAVSFYSFVKPLLEEEVSHVKAMKRSIRSIQ